ncbi:hypothetical protein [Sporosarcina limicola]|uniref:Uncharacterized protein n=1 Tax=Sporosarcina limicola TaxID=34101 RepID=A0A927ML80_9BACL|nr:hypothetical protein [Sporosarcina limicola]MBE1556420.1 hypothetical protein [Sporosarcina limicola]
MNYIEKDKEKYWYTLFFLPLFFTPRGLYQSFVTADYLHLGDSGFVFPIYFFIGIFIFFLLLKSFILNGSLRIISSEIKFNLLILAMVGLFISSAGVIVHSDISVYIRYIQMLTGFVGLFISWYLFEYKRLNVEKFFGKLGILYFIIIILNYLYSFSQVGLASFGRGLQPSLGIIDIYQTHVYYPFIINTILFMSLPYIMKRYKYLFYIYIGVYLLYLLSWQVRGAILSFAVMIVIAIVFKFKLIQKIGITVFLFLFLIALVYYFDPELVLGRFSNIEGVKNFSGRTDIWLSVFTDFNTLKLIFGNLYFDQDGVTAHNQYIELLDMGGILLLLSLLAVLLNVFYLLLKTIKSKAIRNRNPNLLYYILILIVQWIIDFNVNVPMSNTNPSIFYWFYLNSVFVIYHLNKKGKPSLAMDKNDRGI